MAIRAVILRKGVSYETAKATTQSAKPQTWRC